MEAGAPPEARSAIFQKSFQEQCLNPWARPWSGGSPTRNKDREGLSAACLVIFSQRERWCDCGQTKVRAAGRRPLTINGEPVHLWVPASSSFISSTGFLGKAVSVSFDTRLQSLALPWLHEQGLKVSGIPAHSRGLGFLILKACLPGGGGLFCFCLFESFLSLWFHLLSYVAFGARRQLLHLEPSRRGPRGKGASTHLNR